MTGRVELLGVDEASLAKLLAVAVADAAPEEVMPPVPGPPGWTAERRERFRRWHRSRFPALTGPHRESTFAVVHDGKIVGSARLALRDASDVLEAGVWLGRSHRGHGIGTASVRLLVAEAAKAGARTVVANTMTHNTAALGALRGNGARLVARDGAAEIHAELTPEGLPGTVAQGIARHVTGRSGTDPSHA